MQIISTIVPIFIVILIGWGIQRHRFMPPEFLGPANRLVYYVAIPAMIFQAVAGSSLLDWFSVRVIAIILTSAIVAYAFSWGLSRVLGFERMHTGTFIQSSGHGNIGYIGLAVAYYYLGEAGLVQTSVLGGFLIILQNMLSVTALTVYGADHGEQNSVGSLIGKVLGNPVIISVLAGMMLSLLRIPIPVILDRSLDIISALALPMALLIIGASLSFNRIRSYITMVICAGIVKVIGFPAIGLGLFRLFGVEGTDMVSGVILMACPTATVTYVMSKEMFGDDQLATATITFSTLLSALTFTFWLKLATTG